jgi:hypothetical protein
MSGEKVILADRDIWTSEHISLLFFQQYKIQPVTVRAVLPEFSLLTSLRSYFWLAA